MSDAPIPPSITIACWCKPPKTLTADSEHPRAWCEACGVEVLIGVLTPGPRLRLADGGTGAS